MTLTLNLFSRSKVKDNVPVGLVCFKVIIFIFKKTQQLSGAITVLRDQRILNLKGFFNWLLPISLVKVPCPYVERFSRRSANKGFSLKVE
jgi:hypothetical protein